MYNFPISSQFLCTFPFFFHPAACFSSEIPKTGSDPGEYQTVEEHKAFTWYITVIITLV